MHQIIVDFGEVEFFGSQVQLRIFAYGLMMVLGFISAVLLARWRAKRAGENANVITQAGVFALVGGVGGARFAYVIEHWDQYSTADELWAAMFDISGGGLIYLGGLAGGFLLVTGYLLLKRVPLRRFLDIVAPALMIGLAFGRVGCYMNGCCWGGPAAENSAISVQFPMMSKPLYTANPTGYCPDQTISPAYWHQLREGKVSPDQRLINSFRRYNIKHLALIPPIEFHRKLSGEQLSVMFASNDEIRKLFTSAAGEDQMLSRDEWDRELAQKTGLLRGSEIWSEAAYFDADFDGLLSYGEFSVYLGQRKIFTLEKFDANNNRRLTDNELTQANAFFQADMFELLADEKTLPVAPAQLFGVANALLICVLLCWFYRHRRFEGQIFSIMLIFYSAGRFMLESIRHDDKFNIASGNWTHNQISGVVIFAAGVGMWLLCKKLSPSAGKTLASRAEGRTR